MNASDEDDEVDYESKYEEVETMRGQGDPTYVVRSFSNHAAASIRGASGRRDATLFVR